MNSLISCFCSYPYFFRDRSGETKKESSVLLSMLTCLWVWRVDQKLSLDSQTTWDLQSSIKFPLLHGEESFLHPSLLNFFTCYSFLLENCTVGKNEQKRLKGPECTLYPLYLVPREQLGLTPEVRVKSWVLCTARYSTETGTNRNPSSHHTDDLESIFDFCSPRNLLLMPNCGFVGPEPWCRE